MKNIRKSANVITDDAVKFVTGIENIEVFLEENDEWQFHDSEVLSIHWDEKHLVLDITVIPIGFGTKFEYGYKTQVPMLDFHFNNVVEYKCEYYAHGYIDEISIKKENGYLVTRFDCYTIEVVSGGLTIDKPRITS